MTSASMEMSASARSKASAATDALDAALASLKDKAREFARLSPSQRAALLRACIPRTVAAAEAWTRAACEAKGLDFEGPSSSEEWLAGPMATVRNLRLLAESLEAIGRTGSPGPAPERFGRTPLGQSVVQVFPNTLVESLLYGGFSAEVRFLDGVSPEDAQRKQASFYKKSAPDGGVSLVLGAGNVASIPPMDAIYKMFVDGNVCIVKLNPVNEYLAPFYEDAFAPLVEKGYLRFVMGGAEVGSHLTYHPLVDDVHITGSDRTHDLIVWGPPGPERERRQAENKPLLDKPISSELGCVTPVVIIPGPYSESELDFMAANVATMMANNASCNCNAGKMLVTSKHWPAREGFLARVRAILATVKPRKAYYPGAFDRYEKLVGNRAKAEKLGDAGEGQLPWTLVFGLDAADKEESLFTTEPFCPILSEVALEEHSGAEFIKAATTFCNERLWGTLSAVVFIHPRTAGDPTCADAFEHMLRDLRYGAVGVNQWSALAYALVTTPWGAHPSSTLANVQGGLGWVHNTFLLEAIEKVVVRGPLTVFPKPPWFVTHKNAHEVARRMVALEAEPSVLKVPGVALAALKG
ncbi:MAG: aldehyde dehydrogenase family protein [Polyangiales bacterium]